MNKNRILLAVCAMSLPSLNYADPAQFGVELLAGQATQKSVTTIFGFEANDLSVGLRGSFHFNKYISAEVAYMDYGDAESRDTAFGRGDEVVTTMSTQALNVGFAGGFFLNRDLQLVARAGVAKWNFELSGQVIDDPNSFFADKDDGNDLYYGIGLKGLLVNKLNVNLEYTVTRFDAEITGEEVHHDVNNLSLSFGVSF